MSAAAASGGAGAGSAAGNAAAGTGPGQAGATQPGPGQPQAGAGTGGWEPGKTSPVWLSSLGDPDLASDPALNRFADVPTLAKSYRELNKKIGAKGLIQPAKDASPDDLRAFWKELGAGEKPEEYGRPADWTPPAGLPIDDAFIGAMGKIAHEAMIPKAAWEKVFRGYVSHQEAEFNKLKQQIATQNDTVMKDLRAQWGAAAEVKLAGAQKAMEHLFGQDVGFFRALQLADGSALSSHPLLVKALANLFDQMGEARMIDGLAPRQTMTKEEAQRELNKKMADEGFLKAWMDSSHPEHDDAVKERERLYQLTTGSTPDQGAAQSGTPITGSGYVRGT